MELLDFPFYHNPLRTWLLAFGAAVLLVAGLLLVNRLVIRQFRRFAKTTTTGADDVLAAILEATRIWFVLTLAVWAASLVLVLPPRTREILNDIVQVVVVLQLGVWAVTAIRAWVKGYSDRKLEEDPSSVTTIRALGFVGRLLVWSIILLVALDNLGVDITAFIGAAGVGGIAVALAVQNILGDLFASLSIVLDKPFVVGDFIIVGDLLGTVEHVGLKTTRVRSLSGEQLVFANSDLLNSRIRNFKRMYERRVVFSFGVIYQTSYEDLQSIPPMVREIIEAQEHTRFDRAHFRGYGDSSLEFEVVYYVLVPDYNAYMDVQQAINLELFRRFEERGIDFAYPTRTLYIQRSGGDDAELLGSAAPAAAPGA